MVRDNGGDHLAILDALEPKFEKCETTTVFPNEPRKPEIKSVKELQLSNKALETDKHAEPLAHEIQKDVNPLDKYSLRGRSDELEKSVADSVHVLGEFALLGQATILYAAPNTGKTLIALSLLTDAVKEGRVDPSKVYYLNMDDTSQGLLEKVRIADEFGFHMLAEGHRDFSASEFLSIVRGLIETD